MIAALPLLLFAQPATDPLLAQLVPGISAAAARRALAHLDVRWLEATAPGALAEGLVRSRLLQHLNRFGLAPVEDATGELDASAFAQIALAAKPGPGTGQRQYALAFSSSSELRFVMVRVPLAPDVLRARKEVLAELARAGTALTAIAKDTDRYGNVFAWEARGVRVLYAPAGDEVIILRFPARAEPK